MIILDYLLILYKKWEEKSMRDFASIFPILFWPFLFWRGFSNSKIWSFWIICLFCARNEEMRRKKYAWLCINIPKIRLKIVVFYLVGSATYKRDHPNFPGDSWVCHSQWVEIIFEEAFLFKNVMQLSFTIFWPTHIT